MKVDILRRDAVSVVQRIETCEHDVSRRKAVQIELLRDGKVGLAGERTLSREQLVEQLLVLGAAVFGEPRQQQ